MRFRAARAYCNEVLLCARITTQQPRWSAALQLTRAIRVEKEVVAKHLGCDVAPFFIHYPFSKKRKRVFPCLRGKKKNSTLQNCKTVISDSTCASAPRTILSPSPQLLSVRKGSERASLSLSSFFKSPLSDSLSAGDVYGAKPSFSPTLYPYDKTRRRIDSENFHGNVRSIPNDNERKVRREGARVPRGSFFGARLIHLLTPRFTLREGYK